MTQTKVIGESVKQTNKTFIKHYTEGYCDALTENLKLYTIDMYNRPTFGGELRSTPSQYQLDRLAEIENGTAKLDIFRAIEGKKYFKVVSCEWDEKRQEYRDRSVVTFIDKNTGDVYKAASWKSPAKHVRYTFQNPEHIKILLDPKKVDWAGGHLYMR
ncbi:DUF7717 family protein [Nonlabens xiamenensis]|uniref:DUF7717 family protein n=1 Tax=Nonlabens xiamenensis TaxID=2341043 RepID=UPI000F609760|nr:hypothetical protein [Nonlabens xiamenensis]|tara:strand:+ start:72 stop:545 length:474 start_codon:yes stop_codon:yes gene_type:complete